ncbi:MAG: hypothetical protein U0X39_11770 [Bacteroidales bacterium]
MIQTGEKYYRLLSNALLLICLVLLLLLSQGSGNDSYPAGKNASHALISDNNSWHNDLLASSGLQIQKQTGTSMTASSDYGTQYSAYYIIVDYDTRSGLLFKLGKTAWLNIEPGLPVFLPRQLNGNDEEIPPVLS